MTAHPGISLPNNADTLSIVTYGDLIQLTISKLAQAKSEIRKKGWATLISIITERLAKNDHHDDLERTWRIGNISVAGFRGVSAPGKPLTIRLPALPGLTVFHGENGCGKSSIAHALTAALHPAYRPVPRGKKAKVADDPWSACDVHVDAETANVRVTLLSDSGDRIEVAATITPSGDRNRTIKRENIPASGTDLVPEWNAAYEIHRPVFAYAEERRAIKGANDLQSFLLDHLLIGGCFTSLRQAVSPDLEVANTAHKTAQGAWRQFEESLRQIAEQYPEAPADMSTIERPTDEQPKDDWLTAHGCTGELSDQAVPSLALNEVDTLCDAVIEAFDAVTAYRDAASASLGPLHHALSTLAADAGCESLPAEECPVCASEVDWRARLRERLGALEHLDTPRKDAERNLAKLRDVVRALDAISALLALDDTERPDAEWADQLHSAIARREVLQSSHTHEAQLVEVLTTVRNAVQDDRFPALAERLVAQSRTLQQWNRDRCEAARTFSDTWWKYRDAAAEQPLWQAVSDSIGDLERDIREQRQAQLLAAVERTCTGLLGDAQLTLNDLGLTQKTAAPKFAAPADSAEPRPLGVLSAGQQNAFLLAPVVGPRSDRPFGFVVFDDPVHALDDLRIEVLADFLRQRAATHQVIVFTHDERLAEILRHSTPDSRFFTLRRDHATSEVTIEQDDALWQRLLMACTGSLNLKEGRPAVRPGVARALMRQAVDAALRDALMNHVCESADLGLKESLAELDRANRTTGRFAHLQNSYTGTDLARTAADAFAIVKDDLDVWSQASHRDGAIEKDTLLDERKRAWRVCAILTSNG